MESAKTSLCPQCGTELTPGDRFCGECGTALEVAVHTAETPPEAPAAQTPFVTPNPESKSKPKRSKRWHRILMVVLLPFILFLAYCSILQLGDPGMVEALAISKEGHLLASGGENGKIMIWRLPERTLQFEIDHKPTIRHLMFNPAADRLAVTDRDDALSVYTLTNSGAKKDWTVQQPGINVVGIRGEDVFTIDWNGRLKVWSQDNNRAGLVITNLKDPNRESDFSGGIDLVAFSPEAQRLALVYTSQFDRIRFFQISQTNGSGQWEVQRQGAAPIDISKHGDPEGLVYSGDGDRVALYNGNEVTLYDAWSPAVISMSALAYGTGDCPIVLDRSLEHAIVGFGNGHIQLFDMKNGQVTATFFHGPAWYSKIQSLLFWR